MQIKRLRNTHFGTKKISRVVTGWALYEPGKGWVAFSADRDEFGILVPYIPCGGKRALQSILDAGGFCSFEGMEYVQAQPLKKNITVLMAQRMNFARHGLRTEESSD